MKHLKSFFGNKLLSQITTEDIERYKSMRKGVVSNRTINLKLATLKHFFNMAVKWKKSESTMNDVGMFPEENRLPKYLTQEELNKLYHSCSDHVLPIVKLACNTDLRKGELLNLR